MIWFHVENRKVVVDTQAPAPKVTVRSTPAACIAEASAPGEAATTRFATELGAARGTLRSVSLVNQEISGSPMSPTVTTALVLEFDRGSSSAEGTESTDP